MTQTYEGVIKRGNVHLSLMLICQMARMCI